MPWEFQQIHDAAMIGAYGSKRGMPDGHGGTHWISDADEISARVSDFLDDGWKVLGMSTNSMLMGREIQ